VLLSIKRYQKITNKRESILDLLAMPRPPKSSLNRLAWVMSSPGRSTGHDVPSRYQVISEFRKAGRGKADRQVAAWANSVPPESMFLSAVCILEMELGTLLMERRDARQGAILRSWMKDHVLPAFAAAFLL